MGKIYCFGVHKAKADKASSIEGLLGKSQRQAWVRANRPITMEGLSGVFGIGPKTVAKIKAALPSFVVMTASTTPLGGWGEYRKVALLKVAEGHNAEDVSRIDERLRSVEEVVEVWDKCHVGSTEESCYFRTLHNVCLRAEELNA